MKKELIDWIKTIVTSVLVALIILQIVQPTLVMKLSMMPTLFDKDYLLIEKVSHRLGWLEREDIVVLKSNMSNEYGNDINLIKRVIALPGETIKISNGEVFINGEKIVETYILKEFEKGDVELELGENEFFVMGDNRDDSTDSRDLGPIERADIKGKVFIRLFPFDRMKLF